MDSSTGTLEAVARNAFIIVNVIGVLLVAYGYPFWVVFRGARRFPPVVKIWALSAIYMLALSLGMPMAVGLVSPEFSREMMVSWVPEGPGLLATLLIGWMPPILAGCVALVARRYALALFPSWMGRISSDRGPVVQGIDRSGI